ncbi:tetratricopeptide repeat protein [Salinivirga cyanobacteriivorans]
MRITALLITIFVNQLVFAQADTVLLRAQGLYNQGNYEEAWKLFARTDNDEDWVMKRKLELAWLTGRFDEMYQLADQMDGYRHTGTKLHYLMRYHAVKGDNDKAFEMLTKLLESRHKPPRAAIRTDTAFDRLKKMPEWDSIWKGEHYKSYDIKLAMAKRELEVQNYDLAITLLDELIEDRSYREMPWFYRSKLLFEQGFTKSALEDIDRAIEEEDDEAAFYALQAKILHKLGRERKALKSISRAIDIDPYQPDFYLQGIEVCKTLEKYQEGYKYAEKYLTAYPDKPEALHKYALMVYRTGSCMKALPYINKAIAKQKYNPELYFLRAQIYQSCKVYAQAEKDYAMCLDFWPQKAALYYGRAICRHHTGNKKGSCRDLQKALDLGALEADKKLSEWCR